MAASAYTGSKWGALGSAGSPGGLVTWSFDIAGARLYAFDSVMAADGYKAAIRTAFSLWESVANIDFTEVASGGPAQIQLGWDAIDGRGGTLASASWLNQVGGVTIDAEVAFDPAEAWSTVPGQGTSLYAVAVHEIGHAIGLAHSDEPGSIMYPYLGSQTQPSAADLAAIRSLYGSSVSSGPAGAGGSMTGTDGNDILAGGSALQVAGGGGSDTITAAPLAGTVATVYGGRAASDPNDGADSITVGGDGSVLIFGNGGDDTILDRAAGAGTIYGGFGHDAIRVENGAGNQIFGGADLDTIVVIGGGNNTVFGGQAAADPGDAADVITVEGSGNNLVYANGGNDRISVSGTGSNWIFGGLGNDTIVGGSGADRLVGNSGDNIYTGGLGADRFVHDAGARDIVTDFHLSQGDRLETGGQVGSLTTASDGSAALVFGDGGVIILHGVTQNEFSSAYFA